MGKWQNTKKITHKRAKRPALSQQVATRLHWIDEKSWQTGNINNKKGSTKEAPPWHGQLKNIFTGGLKLVLWYQPLPYFWCGSRQIDVWFAWTIPNLSMYHLLLKTNFVSMKRVWPGNSLDPDQTWHFAKLFDTLMVFLKEFFNKVDFEKYQQTTKEAWKIPRTA